MGKIKGVLPCGEGKGTAEKKTWKDKAAKKKHSDINRKEKYKKRWKDRVRKE